MYVPVCVSVTSKWFGWPGMTSRLNRNSGTQNEWITSGEVRLNRTVSPGRQLEHRQRPRYITPLSVTLYCGYWNGQLHWYPTTLTVTSGFADS